MGIWNATREIEKRAEDGIRDAYDTVRKEGARGVTMARKGIERRPLSAVGIALLIGVVFGSILGFMFGRRH